MIWSFNLVTNIHIIYEYDNSSLIICQASVSFCQGEKWRTAAPGGDFVKAWSKTAKLG
jgi:hypothetical protein